MTEPNLRAGALRAALDQIRIQTGCGWTRKRAVEALDRDDVSRERESFTPEEEQVVERACEDVTEELGG